MSRGKGYGCRLTIKVLEGIIFIPGSQLLKMDMEIHHSPAANADKTVIFEKTFKQHFKGLHAYACTIVKDEAEAEEIVQNVFFKLWEKDGLIQTLQSVSAYLYRAVYNESINYLRHEKVKASHRVYAMRMTEETNNKTSRASVTELERKLEEALNELPEKCRTVFQMSRFEELKYHEIAAKMDISVKTVENHMGKALKLLRLKLVDYLPALWLILFNL